MESDLLASFKSKAVILAAGVQRLVPGTYFHLPLLSLPNTSSPSSILTMPVLTSDTVISSSTNPILEPIEQDRKQNDNHLPLTLLKIRTLSSAGARRFLHSIDAATILTEAIKTVRRCLTPEGEEAASVRSITLILREFDGVAYTTGKDIDFEHKEIHLSTSYVESLPADLQGIKREITGVLVHEMVHVLQWSGQDHCNSGLIEGIADWVRLKAGLTPTHWRQKCDGCGWDTGYEVTAYFLEWLNEKFGKGTVVSMNQMLKEEYNEQNFWKEVCRGKEVIELWKEYSQTLAGTDEQGAVKSLRIRSPSRTSDQESDSDALNGGEFKYHRS